MPDFHNPAAFLLLLFIPVLYLLRKSGFFSRMAFLVTISDWNGKTFSWKKKTRNFASMLSRISAVLAFFFAVLALADPVLYRQERIYTSRGTDVMFVIDVSPSMAAKDIGAVTRLDVAKKAVIDLVNDNPGASFGVVAMGEEASIVIPPTVDKSIFMERLKNIKLGYLGNGTAIGTGLSTAVFHMVSSAAPKKCIVLITDGENNAGSIHPETAAELAYKNNITVYTLGVGTDGTVPIEYVDPISGKSYSGFLNSTFDISALRSISQIGGGRFFEIQSTGDFSLALSVIIKNQGVVQTYHSKTVNYEFYDTLILIAGILFAFSWFIRSLCLQEFI
ncbi:MAG: VWA domain-containing protein [Treponema sp.]|nr:VWA domain-containing protein [Treponema sp.]